MKQDVAGNDAGIVLGTATIRTMDELGLTQKSLSQIVGKDAAAISRIRQGKEGIKPNSKEGEAAINFIRVYRSLASLVGDGRHNIQAWIKSHNSALHGVPEDLMKTTHGLVSVNLYLDAMRG